MSSGSTHLFQDDHMHSVNDDIKRNLLMHRIHLFVHFVPCVCHSYTTLKIRVMIMTLIGFHGKKEGHHQISVMTTV